MSITKKPTIIIIPGAWHIPAHYASLITSLESKGHKVLSLKLPSVNPPDPNSTTVTTEKDFVLQNLINPELSLGNSVIVLAHSYGGVIAGAACKGLSPAEQGEGKPAVLGWIYICALVGFTGTKMIPTKDQLASWAELHEEEGICTIRDPPTSVYSHVDDEVAVKKAVEMVGTHSWMSFNSDSPPQAWEDEHWDGRRDYYVETTKVKWEIEGLEDAGHSPFMSHLPQLTSIVEKYAKQWS